MGHPKRWLSTKPAAAAAKLLQSCPTLCDPIDGSPPGSPIPGILQARTLEWVAVSFSNAWKWKMKVKSLSHVRPSATPWTAAFQAPPSMGFSRQEYWSGVPLPSLSISKFHTQACWNCYCLQFGSIYFNYGRLQAFLVLTIFFGHLLSREFYDNFWRVKEVFPDFLD